MTVIDRRAVLLRMQPWGEAAHGGALRSEQIAELVTRALPDAVQHTAPHPRSLPRAELAALAARGIGLAATRARAPLRAIYDRWLEGIVAGLGLRSGDLIVYDADRRYGPALVRIAARRGLRLVALPHNIEALIPVGWPIAIDPAATARSLGNDMAWLRRADAVWAIGTLDQDILQLFGIAAQLLPYTPVGQRRDELIGVRNRRQAGPGPVLILGTVHNSPTRAGMLEQIAMARTMPGLPDIVIAGYGTELLADDLPAGVSVRGALAWPQLLDLLAASRAVWVHQLPMSGALTRITEALTAGVPVIANRWAARGLQPMPGLSVYADTAEIPALLASPPPAGAVPVAEAADAAFIAALRALVAA